MKTPALILAATLAAATAALAASHGGGAPGDPAAVRQHMMGQVGKAMGHLGAMAKGEQPFDARVVDASLRTMNAVALGFGGQFPAGSESGAETEAAPAIWSDRAGFDASLAKFLADTGAAIEAQASDLDALRAVMGSVGGNCKSCHEGYRIPKQ